MVFLPPNFLKRRPDLKLSINVVVTLVAFSALLAQWQFWVYETTGVNYSFAGDEQAFREIAGEILLRATALASDPNEIGIIMAVAAAWCLYLGIAPAASPLFKRLVYSLAFSVIAGGVVVTFSRSALAGLAVALTLVVAALPLIYRWPAPFIWLWGIGLIVAGGGLGVLLLTSTSGLADSDVDSDVLWRLELNHLGLRALLENPITGVGIDAFAEYNNPYALQVHNLPIQIAVEMGPLGAIALVWLLSIVGVRLLKALANAGDPSWRAVLGGLLLGYAASGVAHMSFSLLTSGFLWFSIGLGEAAVLLSGETSRDAETAPVDSVQ